MATRIPKEVHEKEFNKLKSEYEIEFGDVTEEADSVYFTRLDISRTYALNMMFWSSRIVEDPLKLASIEDVARRAICENSCLNLRKYLTEHGIDKDVQDILDTFTQ